MGLKQTILNVFRGKEQQAPSQRPGRNEACWCGSGRKYKKCHLAADEKKADARGCSPQCGPA